MIELKQLTKIYNKGKSNEVRAVDSLDLVLPDTGMVFLVGESGSGKTTLLNLLSSIEKPTSGQIVVDEQDLGKASGRKINKYRNKDIGIVFQSYNLLQDESVYSNIALALELQGRKKLIGSKALINDALKQVGLEGYAKRKITQLSGGQQQRVAIARALVKSPKIIFADEPTGNLDSQTSSEIMDLFKELSLTRLVIIVCHDLELAQSYANRIITLKDGQMIEDNYQDKRNLVNHRDIAMDGKKKSKGLAIKRQLKFALKNLWTIKFRLAVAILLLGFSIATAGVGIISKRYDRQTTRALAYGKSGVNTLLVRENEVFEKDEYNNPIFNQHYYKQKLMEENKINGLEEISNNEYWRIYGYDFADGTLSNIYIINGDFSKIEEYGFSLYYGRMPKYQGEIAVSLELLNEYVDKTNGKYNSIEEVIKEEIKMGTNIVGVVECNTSILSNYADKVYEKNQQKELLKHNYIEKEKLRGRNRFVFVLSDFMANYHNKFRKYYFAEKVKGYDNIAGYGWNAYFDFDYKKYIESEYNVPYEQIEFKEVSTLEEGYDGEKYSRIQERISKGELEVNNFGYVGKNPEELEEDEILLAVERCYEEDLLRRYRLSHWIVRQIWQDRNAPYSYVSKEDFLDYILNKNVEIEICVNSVPYKNQGLGEVPLVKKKFKVVGYAWGDFESKIAPDEMCLDFIYSNKTNMEKIVYNNYGLVGYLAKVGDNVEKDKALLNYCEENNLDYNGIMQPYLDDADLRANYLNKISVTLTTIFAIVSAIILMNLALTCVQNTYKQTGLLRALGSGVGDNISIYIWQGLVCGILVATVATLLFPFLANIASSVGGISFLEPIFGGVSDLMGNYSPYLDKLIKILPIYKLDYVIITGVSILSTMLFTLIPVLTKLHKRPIELLREEGDL